MSSSRFPLSETPPQSRNTTQQGLITLPPGYQGSEVQTTLETRLQIKEVRGEIKELQNTHQKEMQELRNTLQEQSKMLQQQSKMLVQDGDDLIELRKLIREQQREVKELKTTLQEQQQQASLAQSAITTSPPATSKEAPEAREPRKPSAYRPPQARICQKCDTTFPSGQALFKHLPDCQPFKCTKCESTFPTNTTLHKHIRGCRRPKQTSTEPEPDPQAEEATAKQSSTTGGIDSPS